MTSLLTVTPVDVEPLPLYSRDDPDAISIHSAAPSYVSDTPTYHSQRTPSSLLPPLSPNQQVRGLPAPRYAPGFQSRDPDRQNNLTLRELNANSWSSTRTSNNSRQYNAVARRRANQAQANTTAILNSLSAVPERSSPSSSTTNVNTYPVQVTTSSNEPANPLEDPYLVGEEAARRARAQRVYREMCLRGEETRIYESRSWDFMWGQMSDWEERQRNWSTFRRPRQTKLLGRLLGLR
ncbi:hypothetical protein K458DRAFT_250333, partial [Lentithecium fluviatile CBS 122367]